AWREMPGLPPTPTPPSPRFLEMIYDSLRTFYLQMRPDSAAIAECRADVIPANKEVFMATYIALLNFTEQGSRDIKGTAKRAENFAKTAKKAGVTVKDVYWAVGGYDGVLILDAPDDEAAASVLIGLGAAGNVRSQTLRAYNREEMQSILGKVP